jgi:5-methylcytosine-specific restriction endonuclease McrA
MSKKWTYDGKNHRKYDMLGKKYGKLLVLEEVFLEEKHKNGPVYKCICECGKEVIKVGLNLRIGKEPSCDLEYCTNRAEKLYQDLYRARILAPTRIQGTAMDISYEKYKELINAPCSYCKRVGVQTYYDRSSSNKQKILSDTVIKYNGIDQIKPKKGYTLDNVRTSCFPCNQAKSNKEDGFLEQRMIDIHLFKPNRKYPDFSLSDSIIWEPMP